jgi:TPR repeat protein
MSSKGHAKSQYSLANYYVLGLRPVQKYLVKSYLWRTLSLNGGAPRAADARDEVAQEMTAGQIAEAESMATNWKPNPVECEMEAALAAD